ncbi:LANO_0G01442g1_1 [Lachancea nothofagi CBS 11611]|uniref:LANO_0G01442g1_1 n=1 Tax=Lachancea nothofagi CBS 11611 TaxID=1266666 RepID=A0A1G4KET8_9SACH|nr:LANO_0G01442g1_1 [Lachancea nothofagi CBS 11611]
MNMELKSLKSPDRGTPVSLESVEVVKEATEDLPQQRTGAMHRFVDSFKRPIEESTEETAYGENDSDQYRRTSDVNSASKHKTLKQNIRPRHVLLISLATGIGTGMLVGNGKSLHNGGPAGLVIGYVIVSTMLYCVIQSASELAMVYTSLAGGFNAYPSLLVDKAFGFSISWVYCLQWLCVLPLELVTASMTIKYWNDDINPDAFVVIFYVFLVAVNFVGSAGYAEAEFFFNTCKVLMIAGFFILGIIINCGGAGNSGYLGALYWRDPGSFRGHNAINRFKGVIAVLVNAAFAYGGAEFSVLTAAEQSNPQKSIRSASKKLLYRIVGIYCMTAVLLGFLVPYTSDELLGSGDSATHASPFVIAVASHGVKVVPHFINAVILLSVLSVANSALFSSSRILLSLSEQNFAPRCLNYVDRRGRPVFCLLIGCVFGLLSFVAASPKEETVFTWLLAISGLSELFTWFAISMSQVRFRAAMKAQGRSLGELGYVPWTGVWGAYYAMIMIIAILVGQFWVAISPIGTNVLSASNFFENYLAMPILIVLYLGYKAWYRDWRLLIPAEEVDLVSSRKVFDAEVLKHEQMEEKEKIRNSSWAVRMSNFWC